MADALCSAWFTGHAVRVAVERAEVLRLWGLCEARGVFLTGFGCRVRRALLKEDS